MGVVVVPDKYSNSRFWLVRTKDLNEFGQEWPLQWDGNVCSIYSIVLVAKEESKITFINSKIRCIK